MATAPRPILRVARLFLLVPLAELLYLLVANTVIRSGVIQRAANAQPGEIELAWTWAYSPWADRRKYLTVSGEREV